MRLHQILNEFTGIDVVGLGLSDLIKHADQSLPDKAARAIDSFVGIPHNGQDMGMTYGIMIERRLEEIFSNNPTPENLQTRREIEQAFKPVKNALHAKFGDRVTLYRAQRPVASDKARNVLSWTSDPRIALIFAGVDARLPKLISDQQIDAVVAEYERTGYVKFRGVEYIRDENNPEYYEMYRGGEHLTDGDDLRGDLKSNQEWFKERHELENKKAKERIVTAHIPIDDIIWITDRANQSEFIIRNRGEHYIDPTGKLT